MRKCERDHQSQGFSGNGRGLSRPGRRLSLALSRGGASGRGGRRPAAVPASRRPWLLAVTRVSGTALSQSVRVARPPVPTILSP